LIQTWYQFYIFFGILTGIGVAATGWIPNATLIQNKFKEKLGLAMGIISAGIGIGILVCIPSLQFLIIQVGWRITYRIMGIFIPAAIIFMSFVFLGRFPQKTSVSRPELGGPVIVEKDPLAAQEGSTWKAWTIQEAIVTKPFWLISVSLFLNGFITQSVHAHQFAFFVDRGVESLLASSIIGVVGIVSVGGKILWGYLSDNVGREIIYTVGISCTVCGMVLLLAFNRFPWSGLPLVYAICFGMGYAVMAAVPPLIIADFFAGKTYGGIFGTLMMLNGIGGGFGAWIAGLLHDRMKSYLPVFVILIIFALLSCICIWGAAPRKSKMVPVKEFRTIFKE
jgi:MFS family permease